jgi:hypothetical protein
MLDKVLKNPQKPVVAIMAEPKCQQRSIFWKN